MKIKGKSLQEIENDMVYEGCSFYIDTINCENTAFYECSFRKDISFQKIHNCQFVNCGFSGKVSINFYSTTMKIEDFLLILPSISHLDITYMQNTNTFFKDLFLLKNLHSLQMNNCELEDIPREVLQLKNLTSLNLAFNLIDEIPEEIVNLQDLSCLILRNNALWRIPQQVLQLKNLKYLDLAFNHIKVRSQEVKTLQKKRVIAIISGIHSNLEALEAVMKDMKNFNVDEVFCLGNVVGDGPNPRECLEIVNSNCEFTICGNYETAVLYSNDDSDIKKKYRAVDWIQDQFNSNRYGEDKNYALWDALAIMRARITDNNILYLHQSPTTLENTEDSDKMQAAFEVLDFYDYCFCGSTHIPGIFTDNYQFTSSDKLKNRFELSSYSGKAIINVGSVGQSRGGDKRACYVLFDEKEGTVSWRRVEYDYQHTMQKIVEIDDFALAQYLATCLQA